MKATIALSVSIETEFETDLSEKEIQELHEGFNPFEGEMTAELEDMILNDMYSGFELTAKTEDGKVICHFREMNDDDPGYPDNLDEDVSDYLRYLDGEAGLEELESFLGYQIDADTVETLEDKIYEAYVQMPKEEFDSFYKTYQERR